MKKAMEIDILLFLHNNPDCRTAIAFSYFHLLDEPDIHVDVALDAVHAALG